MGERLYIHQVLCPLDYAKCEPKCQMFSRPPEKGGRVFCQMIGDRIAVIQGTAFRQTDTPYMDSETFARLKADLEARYGGRF